MEMKTGCEGGRCGVGWWSGGVRMGVVGEGSERGVDEERSDGLPPSTIKSFIL